jgi:hypothetical protein
MSAEGKKKPSVRRMGRTDSCNIRFPIFGSQRSTSVVTAPVSVSAAAIVVRAVSGVAGPLRLQPRFVVATTLVSALVSLSDGIIAILITAEQASQLLLPVRRLRRRSLHYSGRGGSECQSEK